MKRKTELTDDQRAEQTARSLRSVKPFARDLQAIRDGQPGVLTAYSYAKIVEQQEGVAFAVAMAATRAAAPELFADWHAAMQSSH